MNKKKEQNSFKNGGRTLWLKCGVGEWQRKGLKKNRKQLRKGRCYTGFKTHHTNLPNMFSLGNIILICGRNCLYLEDGFLVFVLA